MAAVACSDVMEAGRVFHSVLALVANLMAVVCFRFLAAEWVLQLALAPMPELATVGCFGSGN